MFSKIGLLCGVDGMKNKGKDSHGAGDHTK